MGRPLVVSRLLLLRGIRSEVCQTGEYGQSRNPAAAPPGGCLMGRKFKHLYDALASEENLRLAYQRASSGKRGSFGYLAFREDGEVLLEGLRQGLADQTWQPRPFREFTVYEPKPRLISAPPFADRVVHHALCAVIEPIFDATFLPTSFACRAGKGTHAGVKWVQSQLRRNGFTHFLKTDFRSYFASIDRAVLHAQYRKKVTCCRTLWLMEQITPPEGVGLPIGALTSQLGANVYGNVIDHYLHHELRVPFARYMDDIVVLGHDAAHLREVKDGIESVAAERLHLRLSRWQASPVSRGINFLGYRIWPTHKLLRRTSVARAKAKIKACAAHGDDDALRAFLGSWGGHASWADAHNLKTWLADRHDLSRAAGRPRKPTRHDLLLEMIGAA